MVSEGIIKYIFIVGFHHKRGCEIEFSYPSDGDDSSSYLFKKLPSLALPDGVHKLKSDTFFFILPSDKKDENVYFGIACFRQVSAESVKSKSEDVTRNSIQKTVVVLSRRPYFGPIGTLLSGITENYFVSGEFQNYEIIVESYHQMNQHFELILKDYQLKSSTDDLCSLSNEELSISDLLIRYEHDLLMILKLLLLQKKTLFFMEPVSKLSTTILTLMSLIPGILISKSIQTIGCHIDETNSNNNSTNINIKEIIQCEEALEIFTIDKINETSDSNTSSVTTSTTTSNTNRYGFSLLNNLKSTGGSAMKMLSSLTSLSPSSEVIPSTENNTNLDENSHTIQTNDINISELPKPPFFNKTNGSLPDNDKINFINITDRWGFPLTLFDEKNIVLPYANLGYLDLLDNKNINSFVIGASNHLWKMKNSKYDVLIKEDNKYGSMEFTNKSAQLTSTTQIDISEAPAENENSHLSKLVTNLTIVDRRFIDYLLKVVKAHYIVNMNNTANFKSSSSNSNLSSELTNKQSFSNSNTNISKSSDNDLSQMVGSEDNVATINKDDAHRLPKFTDSQKLEGWLRNAFLDYLKSIFVTASGRGTKESFEDFGYEYVQQIQKLGYFKIWFYSMDKEIIDTETRPSFIQYNSNESSLALSYPSFESNISANQNLSTTQDKSVNRQRKNVLMNHEHPGRLISSKIGDNLPGYYQIREYAGQSKALVNRSVNEIKKFSTDRGSQLKSSVSAGLTKLSGIAKVHGVKFGSTWWSNEMQTDSSVVKSGPTNENKDEGQNPNEGDVEFKSQTSTQIS